jgi:RNA polymerase-binding transcription factor DksA
MDVARVRRELEAERDRLAVERARLDDTLGDHDPAPSRNPDEALEETVEHVLSQIDSALQRIADGFYGECESCAEPIPAERLAALPYAVRCVACAERR